MKRLLILGLLMPMLLFGYHPVFAPHWYDENSTVKVSHYETHMADRFTALVLHDVIPVIGEDQISVLHLTFLHPLPAQEITPVLVPGYNYTRGMILDTPHPDMTSPVQKVDYTLYQDGKLVWRYNVDNNNGTDDVKVIFPKAGNYTFSVVVLGIDHFPVIPQTTTWTENVKASPPQQIVPEFPIASIMLVIGIISVIVFSSKRIGKI